MRQLKLWLSGKSSIRTPVKCSSLTLLLSVINTILAEAEKATPRHHIFQSDRYARIHNAVRSQTGTSLLQQRPRAAMFQPSGDVYQCSGGAPSGHRTSGFFADIFVDGLWYLSFPLPYLRLATLYVVNESTCWCRSDSN